MSFGHQIDYAKHLNIQIFLTSQQMNNAEKQQMQFVTLDNLIEHVPFWKQNEHNITTYLSKKHPKKVRKIQQKQSPQISRKTQTNESFLANLQNNKKYLMEHAKKQLKDKVKLTNTLRTVKNQSDYELAVKIGEANDICAKLKNGIQYIIDTSDNKEIKIIENSKSKGQNIINAKKFERQYESLKIAFMNECEQTQGTLQADLKKVLVEVMCLSGDLKKQINLLQRKGISH